jgi:hypothetical protein
LFDLVLFRRLLVRCASLTQPGPAAHDDTGQAVEVKVIGQRVALEPHADGVAFFQPALVQEGFKFIVGCRGFRPKLQDEEGFERSCD